MISTNSLIKEAMSEAIDVHGDDPIYFELLLRYLYEHEWNIKVAETKNNGIAKTTFPADALTPIGVYALADKYDTEGLKKCAVEQMPSLSMWTYPDRQPSTHVAQTREVIEAHYSQCVSIDCAMGRKICESIIQALSSACRANETEALARKYPAMAADMYFAARNSGGKIW